MFRNAFVRIKSFKRNFTNKRLYSNWHTKLYKRLDSFPNTCIAYRILLTIPVTVTSTEKSFSKLKLRKSYLRLTMSQEKLSGLVILSIENDMLEELEYKNLITQFAS